MPLGCAVEFDRQRDPHHWHHSCLSRTDGSSSSELQLAMHHDKLSMKEVRSSKGLIAHAHAHFKGLARRHPRSVQSRPSVCSWLGIRKSSDVPAALITRSAERRACPGVLRWALSALPSCFARVEQAACKVRIPSMPARWLCYVDGTSRNREAWRLAFCGVVLCGEGQVVAMHCDSLEDETNHVAEYASTLHASRHILLMRFPTKQLLGIWICCCVQLCPQCRSALHILQLIHSAD
jgi:hypothetical protein